MPHRLTLSILLWSVLISSLVAQTPVSIVATDAKTRTPLPYALLTFGSAPGGAYADEAGRITAASPLTATEAIVSAVGYRTDTVALSSLPDTIRLRPVAYQTEVVTVAARRGKVETVRYGKSSLPFPATYGYSSLPGSLVVRYLGGDWERNGQLETVTFRMDIEGRECVGKVRVRVFSARQVGQSGGPDEDVLRENVIVEVLPNRNKYTVDLSPYGINYPPEGLCVGIEFLGANPECNQDKTFRGRVMVLGSTREEPARSWLRFNFRGEARWRRYSSIVEGKALNPRFGATVRY